MRKIVFTIAAISLSVTVAGCSQKAEETTEAVAEPETVVNEVNAVDPAADPAMNNAADVEAVDDAMNSAANAVDTTAPSQNNGNPIGGR